MNQAAEMVPRIVLCMGAATVESVTHAKHASQSLQEYDFVLVRESQDIDRFRELEQCVDVNWVKDCLISGRLLTLPRVSDS